MKCEFSFASITIKRYSRYYELRCDIGFCIYVFVDKCTLLDVEKGIGKSKIFALYSNVLFDVFYILCCHDSRPICDYVS